MNLLMMIEFKLLATSITPAELSKITGIIPDIALMQGELDKDINLPKRSIWSIQSKVESYDVIDHWNDLQDRLINKQEALREIAQTGTVTLNIIIKACYRIPPLEIPIEMSKFAGYVGAAIEILFARVASRPPKLRIVTNNE